MSLSVFLKDDCLTSLTRFAAAHWTVSSLSAVQGHFCTLLACKFTTLCYFLQRYRYRKLLTEWLLVSITRLFLVVILSRRTRAGIFTSAPIHILSYRGKKKRLFLLVCSSKIHFERSMGILLWRSSVDSSQHLFCCFLERYLEQRRRKHGPSQKKSDTLEL